MKTADIKVREEIYAVKGFGFNPEPGIVLDARPWTRHSHPHGDQKKYVLGKGGYSWDSKGLPVLVSYRSELLTEHATQAWKLLQGGDEFTLPEGVRLQFVRAQDILRTWAEQQTVDAEEKAANAEARRLREAREQRDREARDRVQAILPNAYTSFSSWVTLEEMLNAYAAKVNNPDN